MICLTGTIVHGQGKGTAAGFPTANLCCNANVQLPQAGVYATRVHLDGHVYAGVTNIGTRPTADSSQQITIETLILDFSGDIYGDGMTLDATHKSHGRCWRKRSGYNAGGASLEPKHPHPCPTRKNVKAIFLLSVMRPR